MNKVAKKSSISKSSISKSSFPKSSSAKSSTAKSSTAKSSISSQLSGKRIAITGATGFLGTALVERLLRCVDDCEIVLLVRPGRSGAERRIERELLRNNAFDKLREMHGKEGFEKLAQRRIKAVACDISSDNFGGTTGGVAHKEIGDTHKKVLQELASCDILIHSAASVAFDNPIDQAAETNLAGPVRLMEAIHETLRQQAQANQPATPPHFVAISTAYVASNRKGDATEQLLSSTPYAIAMDWRAELAAARRTRQRTEDESRQPAQLDHFTAEAAKRLGAAGTTALSIRREQLRQRWVEDTLIEAGKARAASLGFADAYVFTKALAEQALAELRHDSTGTSENTLPSSVPLSIVRPSIIESSVAEPHPGWIRGFRMAEPIIINYAQGLLEDFPAMPESIIDVIPVDLVVAAICAVAACDPPSEPQVFHVSSGASNPFRFQDLHDWSFDWFKRNPVYDEHDQPIAPPVWLFPSKARVAEQLSRARRGLLAAENVLRALPVRGAAAEFYAETEERRERLDRIAQYVDLYGMYVECDAIFQTDRLMDLWDSLSKSDQEVFCFDPSVVSWQSYLWDIHLPSVMSIARVKTKPSGSAGGGANSGSAGSGATGARRGSATSIMEHRRKQILSPERQLAAFDMENTLLASNVVTSWGWLATKHLPKGKRAKVVARTLLEAPQLLKLDRSDRSDFLRYFYRRFEGMSAERIKEDSWEMFSDLLLAQSFPEAIRRVRQHRELGHHTVLITGALDFVVEPFRPLFDEVVCPSLEIRQASQTRQTSLSSKLRFTGRISNTPPIGENRAQALREYATAKGLDLAESVAYADSTSDLPMLEVVGFPVAVNPEPKLASLARKRGWVVEHFARSPGAPRKVLPMARLANPNASSTRQKTLETKTRKLLQP